MDEGGLPERVEIELTTRGDGRGRRRRGRGAEAPQPVLLDQPAGQVGQAGVPPEAFQRAFEAPPEADGPWSTERRRLVVTALAAAAVALFIGWALGRAGGDGSTATDDDGTVTSETPATTIDGDELGGPVATVDPALFPSPSIATTSVGPPRRTTTTTEPPTWSLTQARVEPQAAALGIRIVGVQPGGAVVELDTVTGELATFEQRVNMATPERLWAGAEWILASGRNMELRLFEGRNPPELVRNIDPWSFHAQHPGSDLFWLAVPQSGFGEPMHLIETSFDGVATGREFEADARYWVAGSDPAGGVIVLGAPGGSYRIAPEGTSRIASGVVIALNGQIAVASDCGDSMQCGLVIVDRATGESRSLAPSLADSNGGATAPYLESPASYGFPNLLSGISPDGRYTPIMLSSLDQDYGLVDLVTGEFIQLGDYPESDLWWAPDSRHVMYIVNGHLLVYDIDARSTFEVSTDIFPLTSFAVRPQVQPAA